MKADDAVAHILAQSPVVAGLVGARIQPEKMQQGLGLPYITVHRQRTIRHEHMGGTLALREVIVEIAVYADTKAAADDIGAVVCDVLEDYSGTVTVGGVGLAIQGIIPLGDTVELAEQDAGSDALKSVCVQQYRVWCRPVAAA